MRRAAGVIAALLLAFAGWTYYRAVRAEAAERELVKLKLLTYMSTRIGEELDAVLTSVEPFVSMIFKPAKLLLRTVVVTTCCGTGSNASLLAAASTLIFRSKT